MYFGKITQCLADVQRLMEEGPLRPNHRTVAEMFCNSLTTGHRFFFPEPRNVLDGRVYTSEFKKDLRLPYKVTVLLHHSFIEESDGKDSVWVVTVAGEWKVRDSRYIVLLSATEYRRGLWSMLPCMATLDMMYGESRIAVNVDTDDFTKDEAEKLRREFLPDAHAVIGLMTMLSTSNTSTVNCEPPEKLQRKRLKYGKLPLLSYHVLEVGGNRWDTAASHIGSGSGKRSHLRRGHLRRLPAGRRVWVSPCFVKGSEPGMVVKDYNVTGGQ